MRRGDRPRRRVRGREAGEPGALLTVAGATVTVGLIFPFSGRARWVSETSLQGIDLALALALEDGCAWADRVRLSRSDAATPADARREAARLIDEGARILFGSALSGVCLAASEVADARGVLYWEVAAVADEVTERGLRAIFRLNANAREFARAGVAFARDRIGSRRVAIVHETSPLGASVGNAVVAAAHEAGLEVALRAPLDEAHPAADAAERIAAASPDAVLVTCGADNAARIIPAARAVAGVRAVVGVGGAFASPDLRAALGSGLDGAFSVNNTRAWTLRRDGLAAEAREMWDRYRSAAEARGIRDPQADRDLSFIGTSLLVREVLPRADADDMYSLRAAALALDVPVGAAVNGMGVRFDDSGHNTRGVVAAMQWRDGTLRTVGPARLATHEPHIGR